MTYSVEIAPRAQRRIRKLARKDQRAVKRIIDALATNPAPDGVEWIKPEKWGLRRVRTGNYRVVYKVDKGRLIVLVVVVGDRKEVYQILRRIMS